MNRLKHIFRRFYISSVDRFVPAAMQRNDSLAYWRARIFFTIIFSGLVLTIPALIASLFIALKDHVWHLFLFNLAGFVFACSLLFAKRLRYQIRATTVLLLFYVVGLYVTLIMGPLSGGPAWLFAFAVMMGVLLGAKYAVMAVGLNVATLALIAGLIHTGRFGQAFPFFTSTEALVTAGISYAVLNLMSALSVSVLVKGLVATHQKEKALTLELRAEQTQLLKAKTILEKEIEERRQAEAQALQLTAQLQRAQKMEAIGTLAGGVAHDLNNILSGIVSYPDLLLTDLAQDDPMRSPLLTIKSSGEKAAAIVQDLLTLARRGVQLNEVFDFKHTLAEQLSSPEFERFHQQYPTVRVRHELSPEAQPVKGSRVHLQKAFMNLVVNAFEAMPSGGQLTIKTRNVYVDTALKGYDHVDEGDYVQLTISDTGIGIAADDLERIFEPFFSKKKMGRSGTGLGMAVVWGTVKDHGGYIDVHSKPNDGTTFNLYLPMTHEVTQSGDGALPVEALQGHGEAILVVDDIVEQREIATRFLNRLGYTTVAVASGEAAVEYIKHHAIDLMVLDMIMPPGIDGLETYRQVIGIRPRLKAIIASGYSETNRVRETQRLGAGAYIRKPYTLEKLGSAVRNELRRKNAN